MLGEGGIEGVGCGRMQRREDGRGAGEGKVVEEGGNWGAEGDGGKERPPTVWRGGKGGA